VVTIARPYSRYWKNTLTPLKGKIKQYDYIGFDVETFGNENEFYSGGLYWYEDDKEMWEYYTDKEQLIKAMLSRRFKNKTFVATNLGFDLTSLFFDTPQWNDIQLTSRGSDILLASYPLGDGNGKIKIIDTFNFVGFSVEKLGKIIGSNKLEKPSFWEKTETGYNAIKPRNYQEEVELEVYNKQDCKISCDFMYFLQKGINEAGGNLKITIASTSLDVWRRSHLKQNITKENFRIPKIKDFIFEGYYGGRTEVFKRGYHENLNYYDINSLYPSVMRKQYPDPNSIMRVPVAMQKYINEYEGVTKCEVISPDGIKIPFLPKKIDGKLKFPAGNFIGTWNNCELRKAISLGYKVRPIKQIIYTETFNPFSSYVNTFYNKRLEYKSQGSNMELVMKLLLNSLYGKFAQKEKQKMTIDNIDYLSVEKQKELLFSPEENMNIKNNHIINIIKSEFDGLFSLPILSSYTTSYARILMYDYIARDDAVYTDTDSVVIKGELPTGNALGEMKLEYKVNKGVYVKPKFYMMNFNVKDKETNQITTIDDVKIKGVNHADTKNFIDIINGNSVKKIKFSKLRESIRRGLKPNTKIKVTKLLGIDDDKRVWSHNFIDLVNNKTHEDSTPCVVLEEGCVMNTKSYIKEFGVEK